MIDGDTSIREALWALGNMLEGGNVAQAPAILEPGDIGLVKSQEGCKIALRELVDAAVVLEDLPDIGEP